MQNFNKANKILNIILKVVRILIIIVFVFVLFATVTLMTTDDGTIRITGVVTSEMNLFSDNEAVRDSFKEMMGQLEGEDVGDIEGLSTVSEQEFAVDVHDLRLLCIAGLVGLVFTYLPLFFFGRLVKHLSKASTPFSQETVVLLRNTFIAFAVALVIPGIIADMLISGSGLADMGYVTEFEFNLMWIVYVFIYIILDLAVKHGISLERAVAETVEQKTQDNEQIEQ